MIVRQRRERGRSYGVARGALRSAAFSLTLFAATALAAACGGSGPGAEPAPPARLAPKNDFDPCAGQPPPAKTYTGILREARCEQEVFLTMASISGQLGVECAHCHVPSADDPKKFDYVAATEKKDVAAWMCATFLTGLRHADGTAPECKSCHVGKDGKPAAKFLGAPRDQAWTKEWMTLVMGNRFVLADGGGKLKCKHCHVDAMGMKGFVPKVILRTDQVPHAVPASPPAPTTAPDAPAVDPAAPAPSGSTSASVPGAAPSAPPAPSAAPSASAPPP